MATWRAARVFKSDVMGVLCDSVVFDVVFGDLLMFGGLMLFVGVGVFALR